jgi:hypothetical protein
MGIKISSSGTLEDVSRKKKLRGRICTTYSADCLYLTSKLSRNGLDPHNIAHVVIESDDKVYAVIEHFT